MKIKDIGGEFALIKRISREFKDKRIIKGIGDDTAVLSLQLLGKKLLLFTTDMLVEGDHFRLDWSKPFDIGVKAMESNISDIAAMGGLPKYALASICLRKNISVEAVDELYRGLHSSAKKHGVKIVGGDTTHGEKVVINISLLGFVERRMLRLRSMARKGDLICVTGTLGKSQAGLELLTRGVAKGNEKHLKAHLQPRCRLREARVVAKHCNAMIDVSDGLASEVMHICEESEVGAELWKEKIPLSRSARRVAEIVGKSAYDFALYGGEDFELVFTIREEKLKLVRSKLKRNRLERITVVGRILGKEDGIYLVEEGKRRSLKHGYDHFK